MLSPVYLSNQEVINVTPSIYDFVPSYQPFLAISDNKGVENNIWAMDNSGRWNLYEYFYPEFTDLAISANIK